MAIIGAFMGGGVEMIPAGKHQIYLQWQTEDRQNLSGVSFAETAVACLFVLCPTNSYLLPNRHGRWDYVHRIDTAIWLSVSVLVGAEKEWKATFEHLH